MMILKNCESEKAYYIQYGLKCIRNLELYPQGIELARLTVFLTDCLFWSYK